MTFVELARGLSQHRELIALSSLIIKADEPIVVVGAYKGDTVEFLHETYPLNQIIAFEPQDWAVTEMVSRFSDVGWIHILSHAIGDKSGSFTLYEYGTDACSFIPLIGSRASNMGVMVDVKDSVIAKLNKIGAVVMNIEGYEYTLLPYLKKLGILDKCKHLVVQFHQHENNDFIGTIKMIEETHQSFWKYPPMWGAWRKR